MTRAAWNPTFANLHIGFQQLTYPQQWERVLTWPSCEQLNALLPADLTSATGKAIQFVAQDETLAFPELYYEKRIYQHGMVATRANWHDFFNALVWTQYPKSKSTINVLHAKDIQDCGLKRTPQRDALTILDESGLIIVASHTETEPLELIKNFAWTEAFCTHRQAWNQSLQAFIFGHAFYEKLLQPYIGLTAHALLVQVPESFFQLSFIQQQSFLDKHLSQWLLQGSLTSPRVLNPIPVLGIPQWWENQDQNFYANQGYFRSNAGQRAVSIIKMQE